MEANKKFLILQLLLGIILGIPGKVFGKNNKKPANKNKASHTDEFDLSKTTHCVPHNHITTGNSHYHYPPPNPKEPWPTLHITAENDDHGCFEVFQGSNCSGPSIQFLNVTKQDLVLRWHGKDYKEKEKLLNFDIVPNFFRRCNPPSLNFDHNDLDKAKNQYCKANLKVTATQQSPPAIKLKDKCVNIHKTTPPISNDTAFLILSKDKEDKKNGICIELYSDKNCTGHVMRYFIPGDVLLSYEIWEYKVDENGKELINTDVSSVRKCSFCIEKNVPRPPNQILTTTTTPATTPVSEVELDHNHNDDDQDYHSPEGLISSDSDADENENEHSGMKIPCQFSKCEQISIFHNNPLLNRSYEGCQLFFEKKNCSGQPLIREDLLNNNIIEWMGDKQPKLLNWYVKSCEAIAETDWDKRCLIPSLGRNVTLLHHFNISLTNFFTYPNAITAHDYELANVIFLGANVGFLAVYFVVVLILIGMRYRTIK